MKISEIKTVRERNTLLLGTDIHVTYDSDQLTLTCISTGGPATTVSWTRDSVNVGEGTETVLNDPESAHYTHTLTISLVGVYTCTVANNKPSSASATITLLGMM